MKPKVTMEILTMIGMIAGLWAYCEAHFAKAADVDNMQEEIHQIYGKIIPQSERTSR